ncbi:hypothetical protein [Ferrimicrobium sp.]|uniref:hypothetical protein n=1 Tax=Ferrimicrobium sp. TaxID=2926050 RepID=UPI0026125A87|nr:hypothetical protein [Ferrimicrobium sp.]
MATLVQLVQGAPELPVALRAAPSVSMGSGLLDRDYKLLAVVLQLDLIWSAEVQSYATRHFAGDDADRAVRRICAATAQVQAGKLSLQEGTTQALRVTARRRRVDFYRLAERLSIEKPNTRFSDYLSEDVELDALLPASLEALHHLTGFSPTEAAICWLQTLWPPLKSVLLEYPYPRLPSSAFAAMDQLCPQSLPEVSFTAIRRLFAGTRPDHRSRLRPSLLAAHSQGLWNSDWTLVRAHVADLVRADPAVGVLSPVARDVAVRPFIRALNVLACADSDVAECEPTISIDRIAL